MIKQFLAICIICSGFCFSQERYITNEEFKEKITWLLPNEEILGLKKVLYKIHGYNKDRGGFEIDGVLYYNLPPFILSSQVKYIEIPQSINNTPLGITICGCSLIIKTIVTEEEFNSRKNILHRLNKKKKKN